MQSIPNSEPRRDTTQAEGSQDLAALPTDAGTALDATRRRIRTLPPEVGAVLLTVGIAGVLLPGPVGTPLLVAGGLVLMPKLFGRMERWLERRFPGLHGHGMRYVHRFIDDFERRYPTQVPRDPGE